jgi:Phage tail protein
MPLPATSVTPDLTFTTTSTATVPAAPSSLVAAVQLDGSIRLTWTDNASNETGYKVLRRTGGNTFAVLSGATSLAANTTSYSDTVVAASTTYDYQVIAFNGQGDSPASNTASATTSPTPAPPPPPVTDPAVIPNGLAPLAPAYQWIDAAGAVHTLSDPGSVGVLLGAKGLLMPGIALIEVETPFLDGSRITGVRMPARDIELPVLLEAADVMVLRTQLRAMAGWLDPHRGDGTLRVTAPDGSQRDLTCRYAGGLESATDDVAQAGPNWWVVALTLRAADPYFYATVPTTNVFTTAAPVPFFPFFPLRLSESSVISSARPNNAGDVEAWPVWTVTGPATSLTLGNTTTGDSLSLTLTLGVGDRVVIDTRPGKKSVVLTTAAGVTSNALGGLTPTSSLWPLAIGFNDLSIAMGGSTTQSQVRLDFVSRFLGS